MKTKTPADYLRDMIHTMTPPVDDPERWTSIEITDVHIPENKSYMQYQIRVKFRNGSVMYMMASGFFQMPEEARASVIREEARACIIREEAKRR